MRYGQLLRAPRQCFLGWVIGFTELPRTRSVGAFLFCSKNFVTVLPSLGRYSCLITRAVNLIRGSWLVLAGLAGFEPAAFRLRAGRST